MFVFLVCFSFAMITYCWCEQRRIQMKTPLSWTGVDPWLGNPVVAFGLGSMEFEMYKLTLPCIDCTRR